MNLPRPYAFFSSVICRLALFSTCLAPSVATAGNVGSQYSFQDLGAGWRVEAISEIAAGPLVAVGGQGTGFGQTVRWTEAGGKVVIGNYGRAWDVSADGSVIVGGGGALQAFRWTASGVELLGDLRTAPPTSSTALGVSRDGSLVVGHAANDTDGQPFLWDAGEATPSMQPIASYGSPLAPSPFNTAYDVERDSAGSIWVVGDTVSPTSGSPARTAVVWQDGQPLGAFADSATARAIAMVPESPGSVNTIPLVLVNDSVGSFSVIVSVAKPTNNSVQNLQFSGDISVNPQGTDISSDGSVVVGNAGGAGKAVVWNVNNGADVWGSGTDGQLLGNILAANLPASIASSVNFANWNLTNAAGVTVTKQFVPSLGVDVYSSAIVGHGTNPSGAFANWLATVHSSPELNYDNLPQRDLIPGGDFDGDFSAWSQTGEGLILPESVLVSGVPYIVGRMQTETQFSISQLVDTPSSPFVLLFDQLFTTPTGSFQVFLDGVLLAEVVAPPTVLNNFTTQPILIADPSLLGRSGIQLSLQVLGGSTGEILIDNLVIASVPEPSAFLLALLSCLPLAMAIRRRRQRK